MANTTSPGSDIVGNCVRTSAMKSIALNRFGVLHSVFLLGSGRFIESRCPGPADGNLRLISCVGLFGTFLTLKVRFDDVR